MSTDALVSRLAFAIRVDDHFSQQPIGEPVDILLSTRERPVMSREGSRRHADGTYRWANLADGLRHLTFRSPSGRWRRWDPAPLDVVVPVPDPGTALRIEMWPTTWATVPEGVAAIRAKLVGSAVAGLRVEIDGFGVPSSDRWTRADALGELIYLLPGARWPRTTTGALDLTATVPGRTVVSTQRAGDSAVLGARFSIRPQGQTRIRIHVT